ncbi:MAG: 4a-hydroxytetrahydrobiopterin dehydratase [Anaerolineales bacterium]
MTDLAREVCIPCRIGDPLVDENEIQKLSSRIPEWDLIEVDKIKRLERKFKFKNFEEAMDFTNRVGELAEKEDHHPALLTEWGSVTVTWWTHSVGGLHRNDFIMAAKTDKIYR